MINPFAEVNWNPDTSAKRKFALSLMIGFPSLAAALFCFKRVWSGSWDPETAGWMAVAGFFLGGILWALPSVARPFYLVWYFIACCVGIVIGNALLLLFFFTVIVLFGLL